MAINAELFDGTILEFPDGTDPSVIQATAKRMTLERQMAGGEMPRDERGEIVAKDPQGSKAYQAIKSFVDPIRPYVEPVTDYVGEQASLVTGAGLKGVANLQTSIAQSQVAGLMELQEARKATYGTFENMPPKEQENYLKAQKVIEGKLQDVAKLGVEKKEIEKKYGVRESTKALDSLSESPEYKDASFIGKMGMIGSKIGDDPIGIITDLGIESIPQSYAIASAAIATRFGMLNPKIAAGVGGASSGMMQFGNEYAALREQGMDHVEAWEKAGVKSGIVGLFDAASFYSAGKAAGAVVDNIKKGAVKETAKTVAKETGKQAGLGAAGEGVGSAVIGQEVDPLELTKEAIGEVFGAPGDAISTYQAKVAEARAAGKPDPEPPANVAKMMADKGFSFKKKETPVTEEFAGAPQVDITGVGQVPEDTQGLPEDQLIEDLEASQDRRAMLAELEEERDLDRQLKQVSVQEPVVEEAPPAKAKPIDYSVKTEDSGTFDVRVIRNADGSALLVTDQVPKGVKEFKPEFAKDKTDAELLAYQFEPLGYESHLEEKQKEVAKTPVVEVGKAVNIKDFNPEDKAAIRAMEVERNKIGREKKLFPAFLRRQGIQPSEKADLGLEGIRRADIFKKAAPTFDELTSRAISEGFLLSTGDDVQDVENFRQFVSDYIGSGIIGTGPDVARDGQLRAIDDAIQEIVRKYEQPAPIELTGQTPDEARAEAEALELQRAEEQRVVSEQQRAEQEARDRAEITRRSEGAAEDFQLGQTAEENLTGQKDIFAEPVQETAALPLTPSQAEAEAKQDEYKVRNDRLKEIEDMPSVRLEAAEKGFDSDEYQAAKKVYDEVSEEYRQAIKQYVNTGKNKAAFDKVHQKYNEAVKNVNKTIAEGRTDEDWDIPFNIERRMAEPPAYAEEVERTPSLRVGIKRLLKQFNEGKIAPETLTNRIELELDATRKKQKFKGRVRGADIIREKLLAAKRRGELSAEAVDLAEWFIQRRPELLDDLGVSVKAPPESGIASGYYNPASRIFTLMKHSNNDETAVHEMLHHMERMLPNDIQNGIRMSWFTSLSKAAKAAQKGTDKNLKKFYESLLDYHVEGSGEAMRTVNRLLENGDVGYEHYQHINPSEFWAVNASEIVAGRYAQSKSIVGKLKQWLKELYQKFKSIFRLQSSAPILRALDSLAKSDGRFVSTIMIGEATQYLNRKNYKGGQAPLASWQDPQESKLDNFLYKIQDKLVDTKRVQQAITQQVGEIEDQWNAYMKEELYHGRTAKRTQDFLKNELAPIVKELAKADISILEFDQFLHNRHAEERNEQIAKINPNMPDSGSGIATADAQQYMKDLDPSKRKLLEKLANKIDDMVKGTQKILIDSGLEEKSTIDAWNSAYKHYVPLKREDVDFVHTGTGLGQGFATRGGTSARATGSLKNVAEIFANLALQRERAIIRSEKARVGRALYGLAIKNPNPDFWLAVNPDAIKNKAKLEQELVSMGLDPADAKNLIQEPKQQYIDPRTGLVAYRVNPVLRTSDNVFPVRINGQDRFIFFNSSDERAMRMVSALKNLDADQLGLVMNNVANITRWIASVNTQYNPVFGAINFLRDVQGAALNLSTTPLAGKQKEVVKNTFPALKGIYSDLRDGKGGMWADLWEDFQEAGGQTGYRDQFSRNRKQASVVEREMGAMKRGRVKRAAYAVAQWLSDYNDSMENAVRLSAYKTALDMGLSKDKAASIAKNLTVNFNRKGANAQTVGALYAFFNASVQGTTRLVETLKGPAGRKIFYGGVALGTLQAIALAAAGFDDDEPPEFIKSRNIVIPTGGKSYVTIPMPLGFNLFPNLGRLTTEFVLSGGKKPVDKTLDMISMVFNTFNPVGGSGLQLVAPTIVDPIAALYTNVDAFGRPISKEDRKTAPTPGYSRSREQASTVSKYIAEFLNYASGGTKYQKGAISPTADQLDYLFGQATGGVGRETAKAVGAVKALATGEELPSYKVPVAGKFYGNTESPANIASKFYDNVTQLANYENEIKGRQKNRENVGAFLREHPEARLYQRANQLENQITQLNRTKKELQERKAPKSQIETIDKRKTMLMDKFNQDYKKASK